MNPVPSNDTEEARLVPSRRPDILSLVLTILFVATSLVINLYNLGAKSVWNDEIFTLVTAKQPFVSVWPSLHGVHPPLFFFFTHVVITILGSGEAALRLISALAGAGSIGLAMYVCSRHGGRYASIPVGIAFLLSPLFLAYAQEARPYALAGFFCLLSTAAIAWLLARPSLRTGVAYTGSLLALLYTHHWGLFVAFAHVSYLAIFHRQFLASNWRICFGIVLATVVCYVPEIIQILPHSVPLGPAHWFWVSTPTVFEFWDIAGAFGGGYFPFAASSFGTPGGIATLCGATAVGLLWFLGLFLYSRDDQEPARILWWTITVVLISSFVVSLRRPEIFLWYRYPVILLPAFFAYAGLLMQRRWSQVISGISFIALITIGAQGIPHYRSVEKSNARTAIEKAEELTRQNSCPLIRPPYEKNIVDYYFHGSIPVFDETYLDGPLRGTLDTAECFVLLTLDAPDEIRDAIEIEFIRSAEYVYPAPANMGLRVGLYRRQQDTTTSTP